MKFKKRREKSKLKKKDY